MKYEYDPNNNQLRPLYVTHIIIETQHKRTVTKDDMVKEINEQVISKSIDSKYINNDHLPTVLINQGGKFEIGGPGK